MTERKARAKATTEADPLRTERKAKASEEADPLRG
jgi:hypothetical protein